MFSKTHTRLRLFKVTYGVRMLIALELLVGSCARIIALEGGPKDTTPPQLIKAFPTKSSTGFKGKTIKLIFDKDIEVKDMDSNLIITPALQKLKNKPGYTYNVQGKMLKLTLQVPLEEETTYTFDFNEAIKDTTEGNIAEGILLAFSTGKHIDAMHVKGQVKHLMTDKPASKVLVSLYSANNTDLNILNSPPDYAIKTDKAGKFELNHLKKGQYYIYASTNKKHQQTIDLGIDEYGFLKDSIDLTTTSVDDVTLSILKADVSIFKLVSQQPQAQYFELRFNKPVVDYALTLTKETLQSEAALTLYSHLIDDDQIIRVYNTLELPEGDGLKVHLTAKDILGAVIEEDIILCFKGSNGQNSSAVYTFLPHSGTAIGSVFTGTMTVNKPLKEVITDRLAFVLNGKHIIPVDNPNIQFNNQRNKITVSKQLDWSMATSRKNENTKREEEETLVLQMAEGAFVTIEEDSSKAMRYVYTRKNSEECGTIKGTVTTQVPGFIVQLLDSENKVVDSIRNKRNYQFNEVTPGNYRLRLLVLRDKEGEWFFGNIYERQEPDPIIFYQADVAVLANWEIEGIDFAF